MWWNLVYFVVVAVLMAAAYFFAPSPKMQNAKRAGLDEFDFPTNSSARVIPEIFGINEIHGNIIYSGNLNSHAINVKNGGKTQTTGYSYFLDMAYSLCSKIDKFISFKVNGDVVATPNLTSNGNFVARTGKSAELYGSGNSNSTLSAYFGNQTSADPYLAGVTKSPIAYNGVAYLVFKQAFVGDNTTSVPNYSAVIQRITLLEDWNYANINGDANPAHILYYILNKLASYSENMLDASSFAQCGQTLFNEGLGMSFIMSSENEAKDWCEEILRTIDGVLQIDSSNGKIKLKLIRDDYNINTLKPINQNLCRDVTFERKSWEDTFSKITIKYTERNTFKEASIAGTNDVALANLGYEKSQTIEYMGISSATNANLVLERLFRKMAYPLATIKFKVSILDFENLNIGDVYIFSNNALGVDNLIIRVMSIGTDKEDEQTIDVEAVEDIFSIGSILISGTQPNEAIPEDTSIGELIYYELRNAKTEMSDEKAVVPLVVYPDGFVQSVEAYEKNGLKIEVANWLLGELAEDYNDDTIIIDRNGFYITPISAMTNTSATNQEWQQMRYFAYIGEEIICYQYCSAQNDGTYYVSRIIRGIAGTPISKHLKGEKVWFSTESFSEMRILPINNNNPNITFAPKNFNLYGESKTTTIAYDFSIETPLAPQIISVKRTATNEIEIQLSPRVRWHGTNYRPIDSLLAGQDEGMIEGKIYIKYDDQVKIYTNYEGDRIIFNNQTTEKKEYQISCEIANFKSETKTVRV